MHKYGEKRRFRDDFDVQPQYLADAVETTPNNNDPPSPTQSDTTFTRELFSFSNVQQRWYQLCSRATFTDAHIQQVNDTVMLLRKQRDWQTIQTVEQYVGIYEYIEYLKVW